MDDVKKRMKKVHDIVDILEDESNEEAQRIFVVVLGILGVTFGAENKTKEFDSGVH